MLLGVGRQTTDVAPAATAPDEGAGHHHPRTRRPACVDRVTQGDVDERPVVADVAHAGEPGTQRRACVAHAGHRLLRAGACEQLGVALPAVDLAHEVGVTVDQAGQQRRARQGEDSGVCGRLGRGHDGGDPVTLDHDGAVGEQVAGDDVEQPIGADDEGAGHARGLWSLGLRHARGAAGRQGRPVAAVGLHVAVRAQPPGGDGVELDAAVVAGHAADRTPGGRARVVPAPRFLACPAPGDATKVAA